jgi:hypothetical protein
VPILRKGIPCEEGRTVSTVTMLVENSITDPSNVIVVLGCAYYYYPVSEKSRNFLACENQSFSQSQGADEAKYQGPRHENLDLLGEALNV